MYLHVYRLTLISQVSKYTTLFVLFFFFFFFGQANVGEEEMKKESQVK